MALTLRNVKGSRLTFTELDDNFTYLESLDVSGLTYNTGTELLTLTRNNGSILTTPLSGMSGGATYTNYTPTPTTIGGIGAGSTFSGKTMQEMWDDLLYPYQYPGFSSFSRTNLQSTYELGDTISIGSQNFSWSTSNPSNVNAGIAGSIIIKDSGVNTILDAQATSGSGVAGTTTIADSRTTLGSKTLYTITALNTLGGTINSSISATWLVRWYWGKSALTSLTTIGQVQGLANNGLVSNVTGTYYTMPVTATGEYLYLCVPTTLSQPSNLVDSVAGCFGTNIPYTMIGTVTYTNPYSVSVTFNIYRSTNKTSGSVNVWVC